MTPSTDFATSTASSASAPFWTVPFSVNLPIGGIDIDFHGGHHGIVAIFILTAAVMLASVALPPTC
ncbi:MAG TPA: hypothetical protein VLK65_19050 [Vicinamibacteria bacterium]|nr:hypothetical protein [Vicinamibacteria bacterium]